MDNPNSLIESRPHWSKIPSHRYHVMVCAGPRCLLRGGHQLWKVLLQQLQELGRIETENGVLLTRTHCQYPCNLGPVLTVYPDRVWYRISTEEDVRRIVHQHFVSGCVVTELMLPLPKNCP